MKLYIEDINCQLQYLQQPSIILSELNIKVFPLDNKNKNHYTMTQCYRI